MINKLECGGPEKHGHRSWHRANAEAMDVRELDRQLMASRHH